MKDSGEETNIFSIIENRNFNEETKLSLLKKKQFAAKELWLSKDNDNNTVLIKLCFLNLQNIITFALSKVSSNLKSGKQLASYINHQNNKGYTALLYCAYNGNVSIMHNLIKNFQADFSITTKTNQNAIHLACQRNHPNVIVYMVSYEMKMSSDKDIYGHTPLHWAVYSNSNDCVDYLIAYCKCDINSVNNDKMTPLHIAAKEKNKFFIRKLIKLTANKNIIDKNNETPYMILYKQDKGHDALKYFSSFNSFVHKKYFKFTLFVFLIIISEILLQKALFNVKDDYSLFKQISGTLTIFQLSFLFAFSLLTKSIPLKKITKQTLLDLVLKENNLRFVCPWCLVDNSKRITTKHCLICNQCVETRRHHCQWLNACISNSNKNQYLFLLISNILNYLFRFVCCLFFLNASDNFFFLFISILYLIPLLLLNIIIFLI